MRPACASAAALALVLCAWLLAGHRTVAAQTCAAPFTFTMPSQSASFVNGGNWWPDLSAYASDGVYMTQSGLENSGQSVVAYTLNALPPTPPTPYITASAFLPPNVDGSLARRLAVLASAAIAGPNGVPSSYRHVFWGGQEQVSPWAASLSVNAFNPVTQTFDFPTVNAASGRRILSAGAGTCGATGYEREVSLRAFGFDYGGATPSGTVTESGVVDWYWNGGVYSALLPTTGPNPPTPRGAVTGIGAATRCVYGGGQRLSGAYSDEVSVVNIAGGTSAIGTAGAWSKWQLSQARALMGAVYVPQSPVWTGAPLVIFGGGQTASGASDVVDMFAISSTMPATPWFTTCLPGGARWRVSATLVGGRYAVFAGGFTSTSAVSNAVDVVDVVSLKWVTSALSVARGGLALGAYAFSSLSPIADIRLWAGAGVDLGSSPSTQVDVFTRWWPQDYYQSPVGNVMYAASGSASWPTSAADAPCSTTAGAGAAACTLKGKIVLAGGRSGNSGLPTSNWKFLQPASQVWTTADFVVGCAGINPAPPSPYSCLNVQAQRQRSHVHIFPNCDLAAPDGTSKCALVWGGDTAAATRVASIRYDTIPPISGPFPYVADSPSGTYREVVGDGGATCYQGTPGNPTATFAVRALGINPRTGVLADSGTVMSSMSAANGYFAWPSAIPRDHVVGLGAGRFCLFAGGDGTPNVFASIQVDVYDAYSPGPLASGTLTLSTGRSQMAAAFLPRPCTAGGTAPAGSQCGIALFAGGVLPSGGGSNAIDRFDTMSGAVQPSTLTMPVLSVQRYAMAVATAGSRYVFFAGGALTTTPLTSQDTVDVYDAELNVLLSAPPLKLPRWDAMGATVLLDSTSQAYEVFFLGGQQTAGSSPVYPSYVDRIIVPFAGAV